MLPHCPQYVRIREKYLTVSRLSLKDLITHEDQLNVAKFVGACLAARDSMLAKTFP